MHSTAPAWPKRREAAAVLLVAIARRPDLPAAEVVRAAEALYRVSPDGSAEEREVMASLWQVTHNDAITSEHRMHAAMIPLGGNYRARSTAVRMMLGIASEGEARQRLATEWQSTELELRVRGTLSSSPALVALDVREILAVAELVQQLVLPAKVRDDLYLLLRALVPRFDQIEDDWQRRAEC